MLGLMQDRPLALPHVFHRAEQLFGHKTLVTATAAGETVTTVAEFAVRVRRLASVLDSLAISPDGRVGTFCWNTARHLELYCAVPCTGRVLHTLNIRLFPEQLVYIANHAEDEIVFVDRSLVPLLAPLIGRMGTVRHVVVLDDSGDVLPPAEVGDGAADVLPPAEVGDGAADVLPPAEVGDGAADVAVPAGWLDYEELLANAEPFAGTFLVEDENTAAAMCYTSGTTGNPKGVVYSHRSAVLHSLIALSADAFALSERDVVLPVVPMFHANAWGLPYACLMAGSGIVFPGPNMTPPAIAEMLERHRVTVTGGVPTIWMGMQPLLPDHDLSTLRLILCGGSAVPRALSEAYRTALGVPITQAWGMTETSPIATMATPRSEHAALTEDQRGDVRARQGQPVPFVDVRIVDPESGEVQPWDDTASGEIQAAGPWIAKEYYRGEGGGAQFTADGWLRTGDVASVDRHGSVRLVDRTKDLIKSGGEWIGSVELENEIMSHPKVAEAAVIAIPSPMWVERPLACVVVKPGETLTAAEVIEHLRPRVAKWWLPDAVEFIDEVPKTSVGKFSKKTLREKFGGYQVAGPTSHDDA